MSLSLIPGRLYERYSDLTPERLSALGVTLLLSDLDFTLAPKRVRRPDEPLRAWIAGLQRHGITFMIVSNNRSGRRVREFCAELGVPYQGHAGKPSTRGIRAAMSRADASPDHTAMLGDKLLTDVLAANRAGVLSLMVEPCGGAVTPWQKVLHALQEPFKAVCRRRMETPI
ncbi:MAG: YqeG family HAD IIIA-type phosphatase [Oscillibacter sp.]|nr:YqeG family HAD IIIA-type phosphatase [Oscillibacter sp.]